MEAPAVAESIPEGSIATQKSFSAMDPERDKRIVDTISEVVANISNLPSPVQHPQYVQQEPTYALSSSSTNLEPSLGAPNRLQGFEDLPENILENVSPTDGSAQAFNLYSTSGARNSPGLTLASLTPVSLMDNHNSLPAITLGGELSTSQIQVQPSTVQAGLTQLTPMAVSCGSGGSALSTGSSQYVVATLRLDGQSDGSASGESLVQLAGNGSLVVPTSSSTANASDLLSSVLLQPNGGGLQYIKVEMADLTRAQTIGAGGGISLKDHGPIKILPKGNPKSESMTPNVSTAELANNLIASMLDPSVQAYTLSGASSDGDLLLSSMSPSKSNPSRKPTPKGYGARSKPSVTGLDNNSKNLMNVGEDGEDDIYIDTRELCKRIAYELKQHSIPQAIFAERVLCRSQGTLSDLLRNPKPWNKLKSGRETFRRMYSWLKHPLEQRLQFLELWKVPGNGTAEAISSPKFNQKTPVKRRVEESIMNNQENGDAFEDSLSPEEDGSNPCGPLPKRPRLVFTDIQKRTLQAIFKETQRPSKEMQQTIAEHLGLDLSTVQNFFMNARRRSRLGPQADGPAPNQSVRPITPPPQSPPTGHTALVGRPPKKNFVSILPRLSDGESDPGSSEVFLNEDPRAAHRSALIENTVAVVAEKGKQGLQDDQQSISNRLSLSEPIDPGAPTPPALIDDVGATAEVISSAPDDHALYDHQGRPVTVYLSSIQIPPPASKVEISTSAGPSQTVSSPIQTIPISSVIDSPMKIAKSEPVSVAYPGDNFVGLEEDKSASTSNRGNTAAMERRSLPVMSLDHKVASGLAPSTAIRLSNISIGGMNSPKKRILLGYGRAMGNLSSTTVPSTSSPMSTSSVDGISASNQTGQSSTSAST